MHHWPTWPCSFSHINPLEDSDNYNYSNYCNYGNSCHNGNCNKARAKLNFGTHFLTFLVNLSTFRLFLGPLTQAWAKIYWGTGHTIIVYVPTACTTKNLERIPPIILVLGQVVF